MVRVDLRLSSEDVLLELVAAEDDGEELLLYLGVVAFGGREGSGSVGDRHPLL